MIFSLLYQNSSLTRITYIFLIVKIVTKGNRVFTGAPFFHFFLRLKQLYFGVDFEYRIYFLLFLMENKESGTTDWTRYPIRKRGRKRCIVRQKHEGKTRLNESETVR